MNDGQHFYISTPIYYVNGRPHIGHAYTSTAADAIARYRRYKGQKVLFLTGTDEHGQKVWEKANERGMSPQAHCDDMVTHWKSTFKRLNISYDRFIRTTDADHVALVQDVLTDLHQRDLIYKDTYTGWYSTSAERFWTEKDLVDGKCPETGQAVQQITESNYFFRMSRYQDQLLKHIETHPDFIQPDSRRNEVLGFLKKELSDLCISRPKERLPWGIELPFDPSFVTYVWFDALLNYLSGAGYTLNGDDDWKNWWPADFHLLGKDILTTHAIYWSTMLMGMGLPPAKALFAHGWWKSKDGAKMSKSLGNVIDVNLLISEFGVDAARYFFLREIRFGADGGFSYEGFLSRYNSDLANDLGNLAHRGLNMSASWLDAKVPALQTPTPLEQTLVDLAKDILTRFDAHLEALAFSQALEALWELVRAGNKYVDTTQPWALNKAGKKEELARVMRMVLEICYFTATLLLPIMPGKAVELIHKFGHTEQDAAADLRALLQSSQTALQRLKTDSPLTIGEPLFPRFRELPEAIALLIEQDKPVRPKKKPKKKTQVFEQIEFADFQKVELKVGQVLSAEAHPKADKLLVLSVDIGEERPRTIVAGIKPVFSAEQLVGRKVVVVANLKPVELRGVLSEGMILAAGRKKVIDLVGVDAPIGEVVR